MYFRQKKYITPYYYNNGKKTTQLTRISGRFFCVLCVATLAAFALFTACERPEPEPEPPTPPMVNPDTLPTNKFIGVGATIYRNQGDTVGAGNSFDHAIVSSFYNGGSQSILYSYSSGNTLYVPYNPYNITTYSHSTENTCSSTLCDNGGTPKSRADFQSDKDASTGSTQPLSDTYHTAAQPIADPYSLTETRFMEGYAELFTADADDAEMANYVDFHALKLALRDNIGGTDSANGASQQVSSTGYATRTNGITRVHSIRPNRATPREPARNAPPWTTPTMPR